MKNNAIERNGLEDSLLFNITLVDGTTQIIQIPEHEARSLGLHIESDDKILEKTSVITSNGNSESGEIIRIGDANSASAEIAVKIEDDDTSHFVYKIIKPEDLNLKPVIKTHLPRGRPRKRPNRKNNVDAVQIQEETQKIIKPARTRSGRITKPPKHIEKDFKKIDISDDVKNDLENDLKTIEFEPLTTNETPTEEPLQYLEQHCRKRNIPARFRCPTCNKAYLGRLRMMGHFRKHPDHGPLSNYCKLINNTTWNFLILTSQKFKEGLRGKKFCQELDVLLQNARILAKYLFKPVETSESGYFINESLAQIFGISVGNYNIDETELNRDIMLVDYLENSEASNTETVENNQTKNKVEVMPPYSSIDVRKDNESSLHSEIPVSFNSFEYMLESNETHVPNFVTQTNTNYSNDHIPDIQKNGININNITSQQTSHANIEFPIPNITNHSIVISKDQGKSDAFLNSQSSEDAISNSNCLAIVKYEVQPKHGFNFDNHPYDSISNDIHNAMDTNHLENLTSYHNVNDKEASVFNIQNQKPEDTSQHVLEKHNSHITLQNELHDVDELILVVNNPDLILPRDTTPVSNMLDTSSNSDDIMNVDQFVNERFKKLTEHTDIDIQNNILNIELPPLDIFHFDTS